MRIKGNDFFFAALFETKPCGEMRRTARSQFFYENNFSACSRPIRMEGIFARMRDTVLTRAALSDVAARCKIACTGRAFKYPQARWARFAWRAFFARWRDTALMTAALPDVAARCKIACTGCGFQIYIRRRDGRILRRKIREKRLFSRSAVFKVRKSEIFCK